MLYIHIPFCKQACYYCDFHFSTQLSGIDILVEAICQELELRSNFLEVKLLDSIYLGGGTPSLLAEKHLKQIFDKIKQLYLIAPGAEITLEANPDDICTEKLELWQRIGVNRLSIGIQSFHEIHLKFMHRAHTAKEAENCIILAQRAGFEWLTADIIYGIPAPNHNVLLADLSKILSFGLPHLSAYCLTIEPKTVFGKRSQHGQMPLISEQYAAEQYEIVLEAYQSAGYEQYEISNFAQNLQYAKHNTAYWQAKPYLGLGPSAHSFDGQHRYINPSNNQKYKQSLSLGKTPAIKEVLSPFERCNELLMTGLRTKWGVQIAALEVLTQGFFGKENKNNLIKMQEQDYVFISNDYLFLTKKGKLLADYISSELFLTDNL
jgi:oxygen-independent coproporphyrinogen III oxidase